MNKYYIYCIENTENHKTYIGKHKGDPNDHYMGSGKLIKRAIKKYGIKKFRKIILFEDYCDLKTINEKERFYIAEYRSKGKAEYNILDGGDGGFEYINNSNYNHDTSKYIDYNKRIYPEWTKLEKERLEIIYKSDIDFSKFGWGTKLSKLFGITSQKTVTYVKKHFPFLLEK